MDSLETKVDTNYNNSLKISTFNIDWASSLGDCNLMSRGIFSAYNPKNAPASGWVTVLSIPVNGNFDYNLQIAMAIGSTKLYTRAKSGSTWGSWRTI